MPQTFDVHNHIGVDAGFYQRGWWPYGSTVQDQLAHMDACGIDRAVCFPFGLSSAYDVDAFVERGEVTLRPGRVPFALENELLVQEMDRLDTDRRLLPLAMFDPTRAVAEQVQVLQKLAPQLTGLKVQATIIQAFIPDLLKGGRDLMLLAQEHGFPVLFHTSYAKNDPWSQIADCLEVAAAFPKVRFNLAHSLRFDRRGLEQAGKMDNVWVDCSAHLAHCDLAVKDIPAVAPRGERVDADYSKPEQVLEAVYEVVGAKTYMWGSDNPFMSWCDDELKIVHTYKSEVEVLNKVRPQVREDMLCNAPAAWLDHKVNRR